MQDDEDEFRKMLDKLLSEMNANANSSAPNASNPEQGDFLKQFAKMFEKMPGGSQMIENVYNALNGMKNDPPAETTRKVAHSVLDSQGNRVINAAVVQKCRDALRVANLWLDAETDFPPPQGADVRIIRPVDWVDDSLPTWERITSPIAKSTTSTLSEALREQLSGLDEMMGGSDLEDNDAMQHIKSAIGFDINGQHGILPLEGSSDSIVNTLSSLNESQFAIQLGNALSHLARETFGGTDYALPLLMPNFTLVPQNIENFSRATELNIDDLTYFIALREAAAVRLFSGVPWLSSHLLAIIERYAEGIHLDMQSLEEQIQESTPESIEDMEKLIKNNGGTVMAVTNEQNDAKHDLETILALIEGWVDFVTFRAGAIHINDIGKLREVMTRRRLSGAGGENAFAAAIGLKLAPVKCQEAFELWKKLFARKGQRARDEVWKHPDTLPNANALEDIEAFLAGASTTIGAISDADTEVEHDWDKLLDNDNLKDDNE
ncbi:MAG: zinc-dependent metalloprotease [Candidatus Ancillula sp.]|jgi:putative hydrolase|nr:zinc-dependent metalloprotease [Candidatus Ancillula sp.]